MSAERGPTGIERAEPAGVTVRRALISVSDKTGVVELAAGLAELGVEIVSTGGTARALADAGVAVRAVEDFTGFPEMMDGRVKTLHPRLYAGLLAVRSDESHLTAAAEHSIEPVDLVCVNLYPFEQTLARGDASDAEIVENIDVGGPTMIRAAAKNHAFAAVLTDPADYAPTLTELRESGGRLSMATRERLAAVAFATTARYDAAIARWFAPRVYDGDFPPRWASAYEKALDLRYGENPHQRAAYYAETGAPTHLLAGVNQLHGKELSFNNLLDLDSARALVEDFTDPACAIVKHNNPCGCALGKDAADAYARAFACDPQSAFGGVIALNRPVDLACARAISEQFVEVLLAPGFQAEALALLAEKKNVRLLELPDWPEPVEGMEQKPVLGGLLVQERDFVSETPDQMSVMSERQPDEREWEDLRFAWQVCRHVRSNAIVIARDGATIGIGAGQTSRVDAVRIAIEKAQAAQEQATGETGAPGPDRLAGAALASDAFFPFADGPQLAIDAGVTAIVQPGGSVRDEEVVAAADAGGVAMVATGVRHFRH
ncbi:MAG TPA: bifunctional phosphoribosylaminoimidazolecarboxamide formyltransferase/IMP cyclohydrolase [Solirubrobacteraceae bacterium]|jgi:phosphoribosylaminoimidazolecarboxamide formyltransferase/IMP cyclohydrolase|nr:bifunctional phosphoribosylaminoimidazolecarboxamide formyltransferase/IMP cyclohydrolase [Solirubrobacteraceae bacterium]